MRRRAADHRRLIRRRFSYWIWILFALFSTAGLILFIVHHNNDEDRLVQLMQGSQDDQRKSMNITEELTSVTSYARQLSDQMTLAKAYVVIAKEHNNLQLAWELSSNIRKSQRLLSKSAMREDPITFEEAEPLVKSLSFLIFKAHDAHYDIATTLMTMKSHIQALEQRADAATIQSVVFGRLAADSLSKNLHCLTVKLTKDWLKKPLMVEEKRNSQRLVDNNLYHFCVFSDNLLATSVVVNSTISNADHPKQLVFHIVTDNVNFDAMQSWFIGDDFAESAIEIRKIDEFAWLNSSYAMSQVRDDNIGLKRPTLFDHLRFYIPDLYPLLEKVVFLEDDVVVQKDLTSLFSLDLHGNVNGAVETCLESFHRYYKYLNFSNPVISSKFDPQACAWAFGVNVFDLITWRKANVTLRYRYWQEMNSEQTLWREGTLPVGLLTFYGLTEPLDRRWHVVGLGYDPSLDDRLIESAAVIHFNGNMKPWLKLGFRRYKLLWERYVNFLHPYIRSCFAS